MKIEALQNTNPVMAAQAAQGVQRPAAPQAQSLNPQPVDSFSISTTPLTSGAEPVYSASGLVSSAQWAPTPRGALTNQETPDFLNMFASLVNQTVLAPEILAVQTSGDVNQSTPDATQPQYTKAITAYTANPAAEASLDLAA